MNRAWTILHWNVIPNSFKIICVCFVIAIYVIAKYIENKGLNKNNYPNIGEIYGRIIMFIYLISLIIFYLAYLRGQGKI